MTIREQDSSLDRAVRLFRFLQEVQKLRNRPVRSVENYEKVIWLGDIPADPAVEVCRCEPETDSFEPLLTIDRVLSEPAPEPPELVAEWLGDVDVADPESDPRPMEPGVTEGGVARFGDDPGLVASYNGWRGEWDRWASIEVVALRIRELYADIFKIGEQVAASPEELEFVAAVGHLAWIGPDGRAISRHVLTAPVEVRFDEVSGRLSVVPNEDFDGLDLEVDMIDSSGRPDGEWIAGIREASEEYEAHVLDTGELDPLLQRFANVLSPDAVYESEKERGAARNNPVVTFAPALVLRRRTNAGLVHVFETIENQLADSGSVPLGVMQLIGVVEADEDADRDAIPSTTEVFLPLAANRQQLEIIDRVDRSNHTVVQGPPGTGKTHTIANLLSHLLATGRRVLVTAQTDRALREIQEKLPAEIAELAVSVVGRNRADLTDLRVAVEAIANHAAAYDASEAKVSIEGSETELDDLRRRRSKLESKLIKSRESETTEKTYLGHVGTLAQIAQQHAAAVGQHGWITRFDPDTAIECPIRNSEAQELLGLLRSPLIAEFGTEAARALPGPSVDPDRFEALVATERENNEIAQTYADLESHPAYAVVAELPTDERDGLKERVGALAKTAATLSDRHEQWMLSALAEILAGRPELWDHRNRELRTRLDGVKATVDRLGPSPNVDIDGAHAELVGPAEDLADHLAQGGRLGGIVKPKAVRRAQPLFDQVRVDGVAPRTEEQVRRFLDWVAAERELDAIEKLWPADVDIPIEDTHLERWAWNETETNQLKRVMDLAAALQEEEEQLVALGIPVPDWSDLESVSTFGSVVDASVAQERAVEATEPLVELQRELGVTRRKRNTAVVTAGLADAADERNVVAYREACHQLEQLVEVRALIDRRDDFLQTLGSGASKLTDALSGSCDDSIWDQRVGSLEQAWAWARVGVWVDNETAGDINATQRRVSVNEDATRRTITELTSSLAWEHAVGRLGQREREALNAYALAVRQLGKGTGRYAAHRRAEARKALRECRSAVPAWIMPLYRIAETLEIDADIFDVVIIDEASQAGLESTFLQYIAKKIVVVGDHHQVSPSGIGVEHQKLIDLTKQYLYDIEPINMWQDPRVSLFDLARIKYGNLITLREHFRCVPEIIGFSNAIVYEPDRVPLIPLRQFGTDRLEPIKLTYVADGYEKGTKNKINPPEADAVVDAIVACCSDPQYEGKSMGVISLTGKVQADYVERALLERLGPREFKSRELRCGDASSFQGSERDVVFLSMVAAPSDGRRMAALTSMTFVQRFNVAASRARDQMWLFHSVSLDELTNRDDMRFALLDYCTRVALSSPADEGGPSPVVSDIDVVPPFDSLFEQHVYNKIVRRGYSVIPQLSIYGYRIDLVAVGGHARFAIECDGDSWHGAAAYETDLARQRELERVGWQFFRVRASAFYRDPDEALSLLWGELTALGVHPSRAAMVPEAVLLGRAEEEEVDADPPSAVGHQPMGEFDDWLDDSSTGEPDLDSVPPGEGDERERQDDARTDFHRSSVTEIEPGPDRPQDSAVETASALVEDDAAADARSVSTDPRPMDSQNEHDSVRIGSVRTNIGETASDGARPSSDNAVEAARLHAFDVLEPYRSWDGSGFENPRTARPTAVAEGLSEIVAVEGPVAADRAYRLYVKAAGFDRVTDPVRRHLNRGLHTLRGQIDQDEFQNPLTNWPQRVLRLPGTPSTVVRRLGQRDLYEVPLNEIAALIDLLAEKSGPLTDEATMRAVLDIYGLSRLTPKVAEYLGAAARLRV